MTNREALLSDPRTRHKESVSFVTLWGSWRSGDGRVVSKDTGRPELRG